MPRPAVRGLLSRSKDAALSFTARRVLNRYLRGIGSVGSLHIDTDKHACSLSLDLMGEDAPVELRVSKYHLKQSDGHWLLTLGAATASRQWLTQAWHRFMAGRSISLPATATSILGLLK